MKKEKCWYCDGTGEIYHPELGHRVFEICPYCNGEGVLQKIN